MLIEKRAKICCVWTLAIVFFQSTPSSYFFQIIIDPTHKNHANQPAFVKCQDYRYSHSHKDQRWILYAQHG